jgi:hypothetical protein
LRFLEVHTKLTLHPPQGAMGGKMPMVEKDGGWRDGEGPHPPQGKNGGNFRRNQNHNHSREKTPPLAAAQPKVVPPLGGGGDESGRKLSRKEKKSMQKGAGERGNSRGDEQVSDNWGK